MVRTSIFGFDIGMVYQYAGKDFKRNAATGGAVPQEAASK
jgi:hypothetical protein